MGGIYEVAFRIAAEEAWRIGGDLTPVDLTPGTEGRIALSQQVTGYPSAWLRNETKDLR